MHIRIQITLIKGYEHTHMHIYTQITHIKEHVYMHMQILSNHTYNKYTCTSVQKHKVPTQTNIKQTRTKISKGIHTHNKTHTHIHTHTQRVETR